MKALQHRKFIEIRVENAKEVPRGVAIYMHPHKPQRKSAKRIIKNRAASNYFSKIGGAFKMVTIASQFYFENIIIVARSTKNL